MVESYPRKLAGRRVMGFLPRPRGCGSIRLSNAWQPPVVECREPGSDSAQRGPSSRVRWAQPRERVCATRAVLQPTVAKLPAVIGRYQILDRIGQGGMGSLFLAWDPMLERQIAIKLLRDDNEELRERFAREARSVAKLRHRNIVTIFDVGEQDGQPFIAMEYIQGQTMGDLIRSLSLIHI